MPHVVKVGGKDVTLEWSKATERAFYFRASKAGVVPNSLYRDFKNPLKAEYAVTTFLWLFLPDVEYRKYALPDDLCEAIDETDAKSVLGAVLGVIADMVPSDEKKSTSTKSPSPESNSD